MLGSWSDRLPHRHLLCHEQHQSKVNCFMRLNRRQIWASRRASLPLPNKEIAQRLGITEHTVSNYLFCVYNKLGISTRVELVLHIMKQREEHGPAG